MAKKTKIKKEDTPKQKPLPVVANNEIAKEKVKQTPKSRTGQSRSRKPSQSQSRKPSQARSKSAPRKETKVTGRSRSRLRSKSRSKSPKRGRPRSRSRSVKNATHYRARSRSKRTEAVVINDLVEIVQQKKPTLEPKARTHDNAFGNFGLQETKLNEIIRRSVSREISQEKTNVYRIPTYTSTLPTKLKELEFNNVNELRKDLQKPVMLPKKTHSQFYISLPDWFKAIFGLIVPPLIILLMHLGCMCHQCSLNEFKIPLNWENYFSYEAGGIVFGFVLLQALLSLIPIGKTVGGPSGVNGTLHYQCNGLLCTFLTVAIVTGLWHYQVDITIVTDKLLLPLLCSSVIFAYILGLILFIKGSRAPVPALNPASIVGSRFHQFYVGREVNPFLFGKINVKILLMRTCFNGMLLINGLLALSSYKTKKELSYALGTSVGINMLLVIDLFWFESSFPSTFEAMYEGTGFSLVSRYFLYPFLPALITKYIILNQLELPLWAFVGIAICFTVGFIIHRASSLQKAAFRICPLNPVLSQLEAISTNRGKKLLVTGWWGWVRHPNYLGFIILHWAWASTSAYSSAVPYAVPLIVTLVLMLRARRVDAFCSQRYQSAWEEYCSRVRYRIFPRLY